jgi:hypothetical protein
LRKALVLRGFSLAWSESKVVQFPFRCSLRVPSEEHPGHRRAPQGLQRLPQAFLLAPSRSKRERDEIMPLVMAKTAGRLSRQPVEALPLGWRVPRRLERDLENFLALEDEWPAYRHWETNESQDLSIFPSIGVKTFLSSPPYNQDPVSLFLPM